MRRRCCEEANAEIKRICNLTEEQLDAELRLSGIDPDALTQRILARLIELRDGGVDTPMLRKAIQQFSKPTKGARL